jgi:hypothetical protein
MKRLCPELFLIERQMLHEGRNQPIFWILSSGQERGLILVGQFRFRVRRSRRRPRIGLSTALFDRQENHNHD